MPRYHPKAVVFDYLRWSEVKSRTIVTKLGRVAFNDFNHGNQIATLITPNNLAIHAIGGYLDSSFKIVMGGEILDSVRFHKVA